MLKAGIIDPVKVTRTALQNAASAAAVLLTTGSRRVRNSERKTSYAADARRDGLLEPITGIKKLVFDFCI